MNVNKMNRSLCSGWDLSKVDDGVLVVCTAELVRPCLAWRDSYHDIQSTVVYTSSFIIPCRQYYGLLI